MSEVKTIKKEETIKGKLYIGTYEGKTLIRRELAPKKKAVKKPITKDEIKK